MMIRIGLMFPFSFLGNIASILTGTLIASILTGTLIFLIDMAKHDNDTPLMLVAVAIHVELGTLGL